MLNTVKYQFLYTEKICSVHKIQGAIGNLSLDLPQCTALTIDKIVLLADCSSGLGTSIDLNSVDQVTTNQTWLF